MSEEILLPNQVLMSCLCWTTLHIGAIRENFDLRPAGIIEMLDLLRPIYSDTAAYGHFGRTDVDLPWEHIDKVEALKKSLNLE